MCSGLQDWTEFITDVLSEMLRAVKPKGHAVIEVGEVESRGKTIFLDEIVAAASQKVSHPTKRFIVEEVLINQQDFTKLANCFKVDNNRKGTNTNRLVVLKAVSKAKRKRQGSRGNLKSV